MKLASATTMRVGGEAERWITATTKEAAIAAYTELVAAEEPLLVLGGGSNLVASDAPFAGTVLHMRTQGVEILPEPERRFRPVGDEEPEDHAVHLRVAAGEQWDALVERSVAEGWTGIEALSGIPGSVGAAPIQNIGAYGQEVATALVAVEILDADDLRVRWVPAAQLQLGYRHSALKSGAIRGLVLTVELKLHRALGNGMPIAYDQVARALGVDLGTRVPLDEVRSTVLALRASKGMLAVGDDPDSVSAGSFFTNPIVSASFAATLPSDAPRWSVSPEPTGRVLPLGAEVAPMPVVEQRVKLSAAWLIERAGIERGFALPHSRAAISAKHTLAITNRGGATGEEVAELARFVQARVENQFGVHLVPEPILVGLEI